MTVDIVGMHKDLGDFMLVVKTASTRCLNAKTLSAVIICYRMTVGRVPYSQFSM